MLFLPCLMGVLYGNHLFIGTLRSIAETSDFVHFGFAEIGRDFRTPLDSTPRTKLIGVYSASMRLGQRVMNGSFPRKRALVARLRGG